MRRFTAHNDPLIEKTVGAHMKRIVAEITSRMTPKSIILRGSFGRGEGSVCVERGRLRFFSDYEIDVATSSPLYRSFFAKLSKNLTGEFGVHTSVRWVRPDFLIKDRVGPFPIGPAPLSISLYESRYGSQTLFGQDIVESGPPINPSKIQSFSGYQLMLNRMAESLYYLSKSAEKKHDSLTVFYWINKIILSCVESLLIVWGRYHFSYRERGRRFIMMAGDQLDFMDDHGVTLSDYVRRATEFKLRPHRRLYLDSVQATWRQVVSICDRVFRHLTSQILGFSFERYHEFPEHYLEYAAHTANEYPRHQFIAWKLLDVYKYLRKHRRPRGLLSRYDISEEVYALVPLIFIGWISKNTELSLMLREARSHLKKICPLGASSDDLWDEWDILRQRLLWAWKNFCYF